MVFYRRERYLSMGIAVLGGALLVGYFVLPAEAIKSQVWTARLLALGCILVGAVYSVRNHMVLTEQGFEIYSGFWRWQVRWEDVEALRVVDLGGRSVRCIVLSKSVKPTWMARLIPRVHPGPYVEVPSHGPAGYPDADRLVAEISRHIKRAGRD